MIMLEWFLLLFDYIYAIDPTPLDIFPSYYLLPRGL